MKLYRRYLSFVSILFLVVACSERFTPNVSQDEPISTPVPSPNPQPEVAPNVLGLMEISFNRVGSEAMSSSAKVVASDLSTQGLAEQANGVDLKLASNGVFDDVGSGKRYVYATYDVRNAEYCSTPGACTPYSDSRQNLTFLAVATDRTINTTSLSRLEKFDGSDAAAGIALDIVPVHGVTSGLAVDNTLADFQAFSEAELALFSPGGSSVTTVFPYGFVVRHQTSSDSRVLAANPADNVFDGRVTFALKVPLQADPADDPFKISMMVLVVDDSNTRVTESLEEQSGSGAETRADALTSASTDGAEIAVLGGSSLTPISNAMTRICQLRVAGTAASPTAYLVDATSGDCAPSAPELNSFGHNNDETVGQVNQNITFSWDIEATEGDPVDCTLDMGDGTIYNVDNCHDTSSQAHSYSSADIYAVTLTATDNDGSMTKLTVPTVASYDASGYNIDVIFNTESEWSASYIDVFKSAAERWGEIITGDVAAVGVNFPGYYVGSIDDLVIFASVEPIDGVGNTLGQAGYALKRGASGNHAPAWGIMTFDSADMANMATIGTLENVILHEMAHVIGMPNLWDTYGYRDTNNHTYSGVKGVAEYGTLTGAAEATVPIEDSGGSGSLNGHWDESTFDSELMTSSIGTWQTTASSAPIARLTIAGLEDLGYTVDYSAADPYALPGSSSLRSLAGQAMPHSRPAFLEPIELGPLNSF